MRFVFGLLGISIILVGITFGGTVVHFVNAPSFLIVFGVTAFFTFAHHSLDSTIKAFAAALNSEAVPVSEGRQHIRVLSTARVLASASGVLGTLIGMVNMLANMDDPSAIGPAMAVALLTLLYGVMLAELFIGPLINRLRTQIEIEDSSEEPMSVTAVTFAAIPVALLAFFLMLLSFSP
jgi:flagellar motor component MotA